MLGSNDELHSATTSRAEIFLTNEILPILWCSPRGVPVLVSLRADEVLKRYHDLI